MAIIPGGTQQNLLRNLPAMCGACRGPCKQQKSLADSALAVQTMDLDNSSACLSKKWLSKSLSAWDLNL